MLQHNHKCHKPNKVHSVKETDPQQQLTDCLQITQSVNWTLLVKHMQVFTHRPQAASIYTITCTANRPWIEETISMSHTRTHTHTHTHMHVHTHITDQWIYNIRTHTQLLPALVLKHGDNWNGRNGSALSICCPVNRLPCESASNNCQDSMQTHTQQLNQCQFLCRSCSLLSSSIPRHSANQKC